MSNRRIQGRVRHERKRAAVRRLVRTGMRQTTGQFVDPTTRRHDHSSHEGYGADTEGNLLPRSQELLTPAKTTLAMVEAVVPAALHRTPLSGQLYQEGAGETHVLMQRVAMGVRDGEQQWRWEEVQRGLLGELRMVRNERIRSGEAGDTLSVRMLK